jgi:hypothetical protein
MNASIVLDASESAKMLCRINDLVICNEVCGGRAAGWAAFCGRVTLLHLYAEGLGQGEAQGGFGGQDNLLLPGKAAPAVPAPAPSAAPMRAPLPPPARPRSGRHPRRLTMRCSHFFHRVACARTPSAAFVISLWCKTPKWDADRTQCDRAKNYAAPLRSESTDIFQALSSHSGM